MPEGKDGGGYKGNGIEEVQPKLGASEKVSTNIRQLETQRKETMVKMVNT